MATFKEWTSEIESEFAKWLEGRPPIIIELARRFPPNKLYRLKTSGHRVFAVGYGEGGTVTVAVTGEFNFVAFERQVPGIAPEDLEECDLPGPDELLGSMDMAIEEVRAAMAGGVLDATALDARVREQRVKEKTN